MTISIGSNGIRELLSPGKPEHLPWYIEFIGVVSVIGMLVGMLIWFSFKGSATCGKVGK